MAWKEVLVMEERCSFVLLAERQQQSFSSLCKEYGISRKTGYKWVERYRKYGLRSLREFSRRPMSCPHKTPLSAGEAGRTGAPGMLRTGKRLKKLQWHERKAYKIELR